MKITISILITCLLLSITPRALAQVAGDFRSRQTGVWNDVTSWQTYNGSSWINATIYPSSANGKISILAGHTITLATNIIADQVIVNNGGSLNISGGTLTAAEGTGVDVDCSGILSLSSSGILNGAGSVRFASGSSFNWAGGTVGGSGSITINSGANFSMNGGSHFVADSKAINNFGTWMWTGGIFYYNNSNAEISNSGTFNIYTDDDVYGTGAGSFINKAGGIINKIGSPQDETYFYNISSFINGGTINVNSSRIRFYINAVDSGTINIALGGQVSFTSGTVAITKKAVLGGEGSMDFSGAIVSSGTPSISVNTLSISSGTLTLLSSLNRNSGSIFNLDGGTLNGTGSVKFASGSIFNWTAGSIGGSGSVTINSGAAFNMDYGTHYLSDSKSINNSGLWTWAGGAVYYNNSSSVISNSGTFNINTDNYIYGSNSATASFINKPGGVINKTGSPSGETSFSSINLFANSGTINVNSGRMRFYTNSVDSGTLTVAIGSAVNYSGGVDIFSASSVIKGSGSIDFDGATAVIKTTSVFINNINFSSGTSTLTPSITRNSGSVFNIYGGTLNGTGSLNFNSGSTFNWAGGALGGSGSINIKYGASFLMSGGYHYLSDTKNINNSGSWAWMGGPIYYYNCSSAITNAGTVNISTDDDVTGSNSSIASFTNQLTGVINKIGSPDNETSFGSFGSFINDGKINITSGQINVAATTAAYNNVINVNAGATFRQTGNMANFNSINSFTGNGMISLDNGTFQFNAPVSVAANTVNLNGGYFKGDSTFTMKTGTTFNWMGGTNGGNGILNIDSGAVFNTGVATHYLSDSRIINNKGIWTWTDAGFYYYNAISPAINNYGTLNINSDTDIFGYPVTAGSFTNQKTGIINKTGLLADETSFNGFATFSNLGKININSGNLALNVDGAHSGTYNIAPGSQLKGSINLLFTGSTLTNNGTVTIKELNFGKTSPQTLAGTGSINALTINNTGGITLGGSQTITNTLNLTKGKITLNSKNLTLGLAAQLLGATPENYIVTNGTGSLQRNVLNDSAAILFPVGTANSYMPVSLQLSKTSKPDTFKVRVLPYLYGGYDASGNPAGEPLSGNLVNGTWLISEKSTGGSNATVTAQWNGSNESSGFNRVVAGFGHYAGNTWVLDTTRAASGSNPYTLTKTNITAFPVFGVFNQLVSCFNTYAQLCAGNSVIVPYKAVGKFNAGNKFTAQLSDATGSFSVPVNIGSFTSSASGNISATLPVSTAPAAGYRIRVISSSPFVTGSDNAKDITLGSCGDVQKAALSNTVLSAPPVAPASKLPENDLSVYPNPNDGRFTLALHFKEEKTGLATLGIINAGGTLIYSAEVTLSGYDMKKLITLPSSYAPGIYLVRVVAGKEVFYSKIICRKGF